MSALLEVHGLASGYGDVRVLSDVSLTVGPQEIVSVVGANGAGANGVRWLGIASGLWATPEDLRDYRKRYGVVIPLTLDESGALFRQFGISEVTAALVIDRQGRIAAKVAAGDTQTPTALRRAVDALMAQRPDLILIPGDVFQGTWAQFRAARS